MKSLKISTCLIASVFVGLWISIVPSGGPLAQCVDYQDYLHWVRTVETPSSITQIVVSGSMAYTVSDDPGLQIFDVTQPGNPVFAGALEAPTTYTGIAVSGQYVYYGQNQPYPSPNGFLIIDVADPESPSLVSSLSLAGLPYCIAISGNHAYVAANNQGLVVIDISDPQSPEIVNQVDSGGNYLEVTVRDNRAFILTSNGLQIFDISAPADPQLIGNRDWNNNYKAILVSEDFAYVTTYDALWVLDISNLADPQPVSAVSFPDDDGDDNLEELGLQDQTLFVGTHETGLQAVDVSNPYEPTIVGSFPMADRVGGIALNGNHAYIGNLPDWGTGLKVVDVTNPLNPEMQGWVGSLSPPKDMVVSGDLICLAKQYYGLKIVDISNPHDPQIIGGVATPGQAYSLDVSGTIAFVGEEGGHMQVIDFSDPTNPEIIGTKPISGDATEVIVQDELVFVSTSNGGSQRMTIYNISSPAYPSFQGSILFSTENPYPVRLDVEGDIVCATQDNRLFVIDISNSSSPFVASTLMGYAFGDVVMSGTRAFVLASDNQLLVLDVSDPANPVIENSVGLPSYTGELSLYGDQIYVVSREAGVLVLDISSPQTPRFMGLLPRPDETGFSVANENNLFVTGWDNGLAVFPAQCSAISSVPVTPVESSPPLLGSNFPNPFNPQTSIRFWLPEVSMVTLQVYDLAGRLVRSLVKDEATQEGFHTVVWDGRDAAGFTTASGVYFYRLDTGEFSETKRMVLIK